MTEKHIGTLIRDMKEVLTNPEKFNWDGIPEKIGEAVANVVKTRLAEREAKEGLSLSQTGENCYRKLWLKDKDPKGGEPMGPETYLKFLYGDIIEELVLVLAEVSGHKVEGRQDKVYIAGVPGSRDAVIDGVVVDVKSANSRSYDKFKYHKLEDLGQDSFGYRSQLSAYITASKDDPLVKEKDYGAFLAIDKELGHFCLDSYSVLPVDLEKELERKKAAISSKTMPERQYKATPDGKSGNMQLGLECRYCDRKKKCWADANGGKGLRTFIYSTGPRFLVDVRRIPDTLEVE